MYSLEKCWRPRYERMLSANMTPCFDDHWRAMATRGDSALMDWVGGVAERERKCSAMTAVGDADKAGATASAAAVGVGAAVGCGGSPAAVVRITVAAASSSQNWSN